MSPPPRAQRRVGRLEGFRTPTEITTSKRSEFLPHSPFLPLFITLWWRSRPPGATSSLSVLLRISWSTSPFREDWRDFKSRSLSIGGEGARHVRSYLQFNVLNKMKAKKSTFWRVREGMLPATTARRPSAQQGIWEHKTTTTSPLLLGRGGGGRGRHRPFSRLCYLSRRQFRNSGAVCVKLG